VADLRLPEQGLFSISIGARLRSEKVEVTMGEADEAGAWVFFSKGARKVSYLAAGMDLDSGNPCFDRFAILAMEALVNAPG